ncbi:hypothetical protein ACJMK2_022414 [Sinanodonta woodiana]|uniref:Uncharacterized protein n=1 Tax=Sinanodonta woodiana TaxID=1069815 RepID=A0ABD3TKQ3_SINWO
MAAIQGVETRNFQDARSEKIFLPRETYSEHLDAELKSLKGTHTGVQALKQLIDDTILNKGISSTRYVTTPFSFEHPEARTKESELHVSEIYGPQVLVTVNRRNVADTYEEKTPYRRQIILMSILQNLMKRRFQSWGGKRSFNPPLRRKRASVSGWGGKRRYKFAPEIPYQCSSPEANVVAMPQAKPPAFNAWGGKRHSPSSSKLMPRLNWHDQQGPLNNENRFPDISDRDIGKVTVDKKNFHAWGGKRSFPSTSKQCSSLFACGRELISSAPLDAGLSFQTSENERDPSMTLGSRPAFQSWVGKMDELSFRHRPLDNYEFSDVIVPTPGKQVYEETRQLDQPGKHLAPALRPNDISLSRTTRSVNSKEAEKELVEKVS